MDTGPESTASDTLVVTGVGCVVDEPCDPSPWLIARKNRKFMGLQDVLAVTAAGRALEQAGLAKQSLGARTGLYLTVGYIPFAQDDIDALVNSSLVNGSYSETAFLSAGFQVVNPLLTFRCLSNMPAYHISFNFDLRGPYTVTYPGIGQWYVALEEACANLEARRIDRALVGGVAHQRNYLVAHHHARLTPPIPPKSLHDASGFLVLERKIDALDRGASIRCRLKNTRLEYEPHDPFSDAAPNAVNWSDADGLGPVSAIAAVNRWLAARNPGAGALRHEFTSRDGTSGLSEWELE